HHDVDQLLPRLTRARSVDDADDIASLIHHRIAQSTARPAGSGRTRKSARLIAGLIPHADGAMTRAPPAALAARRRLVAARAGAALDTALAPGEPWGGNLGSAPKDARGQRLRRRQAPLIAAYRDRYALTDSTPVGIAPESASQKIDR